MRNVLLLLGGNEGDVASVLDRALVHIESRVGRIVSLSSRYATKPWGFECEGSFVNQAVEVLSSLEAEALLDVTQAIERELGRDFEQELNFKSATQQRYAPRVVDIDIIFFGEEVIATQRLTVPHPKMEQRRFVLEPLCEIAPQRLHPVRGKSVESLFIEIKGYEK